MHKSSKQYDGIKSVKVSFRTSEELNSLLEEALKSENKTKSEVINDALFLYLLSLLFY